MMFLGIDTSNYTTSVYAVTEDNITGRRKILDVRPGERGLRQSDGVFQHMKSFPVLFRELCDEINISDILAVGVSTRPRSIEGSYMPVFLAGKGYAEVIADSLGVPLYEYSHQEGHIMAGIRSCGDYSLLDGEFISVHISGGTTEILKTSYNGRGFDCDIIGGTRDISVGQFIDRVGVAMGLGFPAGVQLESLAQTADKRTSLPIKTDGAWMNLSGVETKALRMIESAEADNAELALGVLYEIKRALLKTISAALDETGLNRVLIAGGVASNGIIREGLLGMPYDVNFSSKEFSSDNAMGIAELAGLEYRKEYGSKNRNSISD